MERRKFRLKGILLYSLLFLVACLIIFIPFYSRSLSTVWEIDGVGQYYPAFLYIGQYIRDFLSTGKFASFDLRIAMGEDVFSALNYYGLGDPLNIIAVFSNKSNGVALFSFMFFLRLYLAGLAFILYAKYMKLNEKLIPYGAFVYICSGYMFCACMMYIQFLSPLIFFPLLLLACEKFFKERKWLLMVIVGAYASLCTMYLFYYAALFLVPYALIRTWFIHSDKAVVKKIISMVLDCAMCALAAIIGIVVTFPVLYPSLKGMLISERAGGDIAKILLSPTNYRPRRHNTIQFIKGFLPTYDDGVFFFHEIPVIAYIAVILLFVSFFVFKNKTNRNKQLIIAVIVGCLLYTMPVTNIVFSGFVEGFSYDRWIFMLEFVFAIVFIQVAEDLIELKAVNKERAYNLTGLAAIANVIIIGFILYEFAGADFRNAFIKNDEVGKYVDSPVNYSETIKADESLFRVSNDSLTNINGRPENVQMINDYYGLTFWLSVVNPNMQKIADKLPILNSQGFVDQRMFGLENSKVRESLAGVKYYLRHDNENFPDSYVLKEKVDFYGEEWEIYENPDVLPLCFAYEKNFYNNDFEKAYYDEDEEVIKKAVKAENVTYSDDLITCNINLDKDSVVLLSIPYSDGWSVTIDDTPVKVYNSNIYYIAVDAIKGSHTIRYSYSAYR